MHIGQRKEQQRVRYIYILLDILLCSIAEYFYEPVGQVKIQTKSNNSHDTTQKKSNKRFIIQHTKLLCLCAAISWIFIYGKCVREVCEAERNWCVKFSSLIGQQLENKTNLSNQSSGVQISPDICTHFGCYLYSTKYSWIIRCFIFNTVTL